MVKVLKTLLLLFCTFSASIVKADEFSIETFTIAAGETKEITIHLTGTRNYINFQLDLYLPKGIYVEEEVDGDEVFLTCDVNSDMKNRDHYCEGSKIPDMEGHYRFLVASPKNRTFKKQEGDVLDLTIVASDMVTTGEQVIKLTGQKLTDSDLTGHPLADKECPCEVQINTKVSSLEFASFSWPRDLDFTNSGVKAFIAKDYKDNSVQLVEVTKVPANTGVILNGSEGTYHPQTTTDATDDVTGNLLSSTAEAAFTIPQGQNNVYVLSNKNEGKAGLYRALPGVTVKQYKSYMVLNDVQGAKDAYTFDFNTDGIVTVDAASPSTSNAPIYNISGQRVGADSRVCPTGSATDAGRHGSLPLPKGIYVIGGKKYVVR